MNGVLESLRRFQLAQAAAFRRAADVLGVSETALITLNTLMNGHVETGLPMKELAQEVGVSPAVLTGLADRLEDKGWVRRRISRTDRRSTDIVPTISDADPVTAVLNALDEPVRRVANSISNASAEVVRRMIGSMEDELRAFDPERAMSRSVTAR